MYNCIQIELKKQERSQSWLSRRVNRSRSAINGFCLNKVQPSIELLFEIAEVLNVSPKKLLGDGSVIEED